MLLPKDVKTFQDKRLLLAISGGLDSMVLLDYFLKRKKHIGYSSIHVCHVNHGVRGLESEKDANFVAAYCKKNNISFQIKNLKTKDFDSKQSFEAKARELRYKELFNLQKTQGFDLILTAHHADDQAETVYMRMHRGTSIKGLQGILEQRKDLIYRPFLHLSKTDLLDYAKDHSLTWREDASNKSTVFWRNQIRIKTLPYLERIESGSIQKLAKIAQITYSVYPKILQAAKHYFTPFIIPPEKWNFPAKYSPYSKVICFSLPPLHASSMNTNKGLQEIFRLYLDFKTFYFPIEIFSKFLEGNASTFRYKNACIERNKLFLWIYDTKSVQKQDNLYLFNGNTGNTSFLEKWRYRQNGDTFTPLGTQYKKRKLNQWFQEHSIPLWIRDFLPLLAKDSEVLWIPGIATSENLDKIYFPTEGTHDKS
ncbi:MAG: tRNA lysidine(34) synthetase TilS [Fibrobacter sp.]|nr:tRNA lysidine(34) synthetase TilS [Fibrobacter sp.]